MSLIVWNASFELDFPRIDTQHEQLVGLLNQLTLAVCANRPVEDLLERLAEFLAAVNTHFKDEELLMKQAQYRDQSSHVAEHRQYVQQLEDLHARLGTGALRLSVGAITMLQNGLKGHMLAADKRLATFLAPPQAASLRK
jgi:hemerythrin